jgi:predicted DNA-binding antitoxin AbrB/MazE fold protein
MIQKIVAIYENGVLRLLRPLSPLELDEHSQVEIAVHPVKGTESSEAHRDLVRNILVAAGLASDVPDSTTNLPAISDARREELAILFSRDGPLSELIRKEREDDK